MTEEHFEELLKEMREESVAPEQFAAARERVWRQIAGGTSLACAEFRPEFEDYRAGRLAESRRLLIDDHLGRCAECRRTLASRGVGPYLAQAGHRSAPRHWPGWTRWAVAAGVAAAALYLGRDRIDSALAPSGPKATVTSVSGSLYRLPQSALQPGAALSERDVIRTGAVSRAVLQLADGSRVEMNQRTELSVQAAWSGQTIRLDRGDIVVQAAKQRRGHLRVVTRDSIASVKGTVFAVSSGAAGSVVSVVEGSVAVSQPGSERLLTAGKQAATNRSLEQVKVREVISWSQDAEKYYALLAELMGVEKQLADSNSLTLRTEARLLRYLPSGAMVYFAIPNLDNGIRQALRLVEQRAHENETLNEWWSSDLGQELRRVLDRIQAVTPLLGEEVVFVLTKNQTPLVLAQVQAGRQDSLRQALDRLVGNQPEKIPYRITQDLLLISDNASHLASLTSQLGAGASSPFALEIASRYQRGVSWLAGVDCAALSSGFEQRSGGRALGMPNMRYLFFEQRSGRGREENEVTLSFQGSRTGIASWLAGPGPVGSAEYVSSEAVAALSASTRDPRQALDDMLSVIGQQGDLGDNVRDFESETGINLRSDIASSLGTDFTFTIERPSLPMPGWIAALEVVRPAVIDDAVRRLVDAHNRRMTPEYSDRRLTLTQENINGRSWNSVRIGLLSTTLYWTYDRGYLIASMDRALAARAIANREAGSSLVRSATFQQSFPATGGLHHSGFLWLNTNGVLADLAALIQSPALKGLMGNRDPLLVVLDGETERIRAASRNRLTSLILDTMLLHHPGESGKL